MSDSIRVTCLACEKTIKAPTKYAGREAKCPGCGAGISIPGIAKAASVVSVAPPLPPAPAVAPQPPAPVPLPEVRATITHRHATKGAFGTAFKGTMGCLIAALTVGFLGCLGAAFLFIGGTAATVTAIEDINQANQTYEDKKAIREANAMALMQQAVVISSPALKPSGQYETHSYTIVFTITNKGKRALEAFTVKATVATPGRSVPWEEGELRHGIAGGLEPGETREFALVPNMLSPLHIFEAPSGSILKVEVIRADWVEGQPTE